MWRRNFVSCSKFSTQSWKELRSEISLPFNVVDFLYLAREILAKLANLTFSSAFAIKFPCPQLSSRLPQISRTKQSLRVLCLWMYSSLSSWNFHCTTSTLVSFLFFDAKLTFFDDFEHSNDFKLTKLYDLVFGHCSDAIFRLFSLKFSNFKGVFSRCPNQT